MKYSIVVITYNRQKELFNCLESIARAHSPFPYEVIVIFNGDRAYLEKCAQTFKNFQMTFIHKTTPSAARNFAIKQTKGEYIFFLDDDCVLPENYFGNIRFDGGWDALGGPDQTPLTSTQSQIVIGQTLSSPLCMGPTYKRHTKVKEYDTNANEKSLILCNLWIRASLFKNEGFEFNPDLFRNEENYLLKKIKSAGKVLHYNPEMFVYHIRKDELERLGASVIKSGECRIRNFALLPERKEIIYLTPLVWFCFFVFALFHPMTLSMIIFLTYTFVVMIHYVMKYKSFSLRYVFYHFFILIAYSVGLLKGLMKFSPMLYSNLKENRSFMRESRSK